MNLAPGPLNQVKQQLGIGQVCLKETGVGSLCGGWTPFLQALPDS